MCYIDRYPDLVQNLERSDESALQHYLEHGANEGRDCSCNEKIRASNRLRENAPTSNPSASAAICAIQKGSLPFIDEWVDYNLAIGFDTIHIYDNSDNFEINEWRNNRFKNATTVVAHHLPGRGMQMRAYEECGKMIQRAQSHSWIAFIDLDEFIVLKEHSHILDLLDTVPKNAVGLGLNWFIFDFNDQSKYEAKPLLKRFQRREEKVNHHIKSILRVDNFGGDEMEGRFVNPHAFKHKDNHTVTVDTNGQEILPPKIWFHEGGPTNIAVIHHIHVKSIEEFMYRCKRGRPHTANVSSELYCKNETEILKNFNSRVAKRKMVMDDSAWKTLTTRVPEYAKYDQPKTG